MVDLAARASLPRHEFVYLVLSHGESPQLLGLLRTLRKGSPASAIVLHHDAKFACPARDVLDSLGVRLVQPRVAVQWGDASHVDAVLQSLSFTLRELEFDWLALISGQDFPIRPLDTVEAELRGAPFDAFVRAAPVAQAGYGERYFLRYWKLPRFRYWHRVPRQFRKILSWLRQQLNQGQRILRIEGGPRNSPVRIGVFAVSHPFRKGFVCYKGSDWFTLSRRAVQYLVTFGRDHPRVLAHYRRTVLPSESYFQTVLWNARELRVCNDNRRTIIWDESRLAHPVTLRMEHLGELIRSGGDFARKFDAAVDARVLDALTEIVLAKNRGRH